MGQRPIRIRTQMGLALTDVLRKRLEREAKAAGEPMAVVAREALEKHFSEIDRQAAA